jgi:hypothetical protein
MVEIILMRRVRPGGVGQAAWVALLLWACSSGPGQTATEESPANEISAPRPLPEASEKKIVDEPVKVKIYKSHEGLGLLCDKIPKKFNFGAFMLVTSQDPAAMTEASPDGALEVEIRKGKKIQEGDTASFILAYPEGVYYRKESGALVVIVHLVVDYNDIPGKCPVPEVKGNPGKENESGGEKKDENGLRLKLYKVPAFDGPIRSEVYESTRPCVPWTPKPDAATDW